MKKLAIVTGDNDFYYTWNGILRSIQYASNNGNSALTSNKVKLCELINAMIPTHYLLHQNHWSYNGLEKIEEGALKNKEVVDIAKYLSVVPNDLLIDEEVDRYLRDTRWDNGETFIFDSTASNQESQVYCL